MKAYKDFIISPIGERYNNSTKVGDKDLIINTEIFNHQYVNRLAKVIEVPILFNTPVRKDDEIIVHHNVFRRWNDIKGREKNSRSYWKDNKYIISPDQIYLYKKDSWMAMPGYSFIKPLKAVDKFNVETERPLIGIIKYSDGTYNKEELVGFRPNSEYEFIIEGQRLYRVLNNFITIKYEYQGHEEEYNPSWAHSG
jgi:hypothetical protein|tara:strand:- start:592 stop:1179 length:588 start_codon:yes stop_codon:yes gene_type:complete